MLTNTHTHPQTNTTENIPSSLCYCWMVMNNMTLKKVKLDPYLIVANISEVTLQMT